MNVVTRITRSSRQVLRAARGRHTRYRYSLVLSVFAALLLAGCASGTAHPVPTAAPTPTLAPAHPLVWQAAHLPFTSQPAQGQSFALAISQSDGATAYACFVATAQASSVQMWVTHDRAADWTAMSDVSDGKAVGSCALAVDDLVPSAVVVRLCAPDTMLGSYCASSSSFLIREGATNPSPVTGTYPNLAQMATSGGVTYALTRTPEHSACADCTAAVSVSRDGMRTWKRIDSAITAAGRFATRFWLEPASGVLLVEATNHFTVQDDLWLTTDGGAHWSRTPNPTVDDYFVRPLLSGVPWYACGNHTSTSNAHPTYPSLLVCSRDSGRTWSQVGGPYVNPAYTFPVAIALDGSVLGAWYVPSAAPGTTGSYELRRLPLAGAGWSESWESLGPLPAQGTFTYAAGSGILWLNTTSPGNAPAPGALYTAAYP